MAQSEQAIGFLLPAWLPLRDAGCIFLIHVIAGQRGFELPGCRACIGNHRHAAVLTGVGFVDVDVDEPHIRILEGGFGGGCEIAQPCSNGDHEIRLAGRDIRAGRAGNPDSAEILRMIEG